MINQRLVLEIKMIDYYAREVSPEAKKHATTFPLKQRV